MLYFYNFWQNLLFLTFALVYLLIVLLLEKSMHMKGGDKDAETKKKTPAPDACQESRDSRRLANH